ncbi:uncharacterized protein N7496_010644 [Penicillium cataractarum]|uniref:Uncharacterized protein n=1 Tax=Penicillium cataractarum TaxID=2100454 RepID=A0A9W9V3J7_9EURO|nr:uncharacterized protein N7496_010644 [Penicillium cataractarum]KAJ5364931.1 hypothetical protein N7496_010644 [Penicillium cataractarum]
MARPAGIAIFIQDKPKGLANKAEARDDDAESPPDSNPNEDRSEDKELPKSTARNGAKENDEYYSLKMHREGPNTESGELGPKSKSNGVKRHNEDMANRYDKR